MHSLIQCLVLVEFNLVLPHQSRVNDLSPSHLIW